MKEIKGFKNSLILTEEGIVKTNLLIKNGIITKIGEFECDDLVMLEENKIVIPGFIDQHIHGAAGSDVIDGTIDDLKNIACNIAKEGTTAFLATTTTESKEVLKKSLLNVKEYIDKNYIDGALVIGVHLEGPFISKEYSGAQLEEEIDNPSIETFIHYNNVSGNNIKIVTLAPEMDGAIELIEYLSKNKIVASIGHSAATYSDVMLAVDSGLTCSTHTYNAQKPIHHREVGTVGAVLLCNNLYAEIICDGVHVSYPAVKFLLKNKTLDKVILVTDSLRPKYLKDGIYIEPSGQEIIVKNSVARLTDGTLAGSTLKMNVAVKNIIDSLGLSFIDAVKLASENPAKNLSIFDKMGSIKEGKYANLLIVDNDINIYKTIRNGYVIYEKSEE